MKTKTLFLALSLLIGSSSVASAQDKKPAASKKAEKKAPKDSAPAPDVTYLDLSGPSAPESELPEITKKGSL